MTGLLIIPSKFKIIESESFASCSGFTGLTLPESLIEIGNKAFINCTKFVGNLEIPSSVKALGQAAFQGCIGFDGSLTIGQQVSSLPENVFEATNFKSVYFTGTNNIENCNNLGGINPEIVHVPSNYEGESFCGKPIDKNTTVPTIMITTPEQTISSELEPNPVEQNKSKPMKKGAIITIGVVSDVVVIAVVVIVVLIINKKKLAKKNKTINSKLFDETL